MVAYKTRNDFCLKLISTFKEYLLLVSRLTSGSNLILTPIYSNIMPGGYIEAKETDVYTRSNNNTVPNNASLKEWERACIQAYISIRQQSTAPGHIKEWISEAGFIDIQERQFKLPINSWPKNSELKVIGRYQIVQYLEALSPFALGLLIEVAGWSRKRVEVFLVDVRKDISNRQFHAYYIV